MGSNLIQLLNVKSETGPLTEKKISKYYILKKEYKRDYFDGPVYVLSGYIIGKVYLAYIHAIGVGNPGFSCGSGLKNRVADNSEN